MHPLKVKLDIIYIMTCIIISNDISTGDVSILVTLFRESSSQTDIKLHPVIRLSKTKYPSQEALQWARVANKNQNYHPTWTDTDGQCTLSLVDGKAAGLSLSMCLK